MTSLSDAPVQFHIGLDVHSAHTTIHVLDTGGRCVHKTRINDTPLRAAAELIDWLDGRVANVCFEASLGYVALYAALAPCCRRVAVAHPGQLRLIFRSKKKNDRADAEKLAKLLYLDQVPEAFVPPEEVRNWRKMIEVRSRTVGKRTRVKNALQAILRSLSRQVPAEFGLWSRAGLAWLRTQSLPEAEALDRDLLLDELDLLDDQIRRLTKTLDALARRSPAITLLRTIPGVGPRTAEAVAAYIGTAKRFDSAKQVAAYFGLVPKQDQSGRSNRLGHISKEGPGTPRGLLIEASWQAIRRSESLQARFDRIHGGKPDRRKIALVAVAHHLVRVMYAMLRDNRPWSEAGPERKPASAAT